MTQAVISEQTSDPFAIIKRTDILFASGLITILVILVLPLHKYILDLFFAGSIAFSVLILLTTLFIQKPLEFSAFPTILLITTMIRLSLNVASTRLILTNGHEGGHAAGRVIQAFGNFIMSGNFVIGFIIFAILIIVNFIVITKGSGRIAEVSARFSLDAMPGKQMAIDADLSSGLIQEDEARKRRKELESESNFFGAMDGAAKFVRGDAIAGLLIAFINVIGGIIIGVLQNNMSFFDATKTYTLLSVGDGLVTQIPALLISTAAGLLVSKAGIDGTTDKALFQQLGAYPTALGMCSFLMLSLSFIPQIPFLPFAALSIATGLMAKRLFQIAKEAQRVDDVVSEEPKEKTQEEIIQDAMKIDTIKIELGYGLVGLVNSNKDYRLTEHVKTLRKQLASSMGFILPSVRINDNLGYSPNEYTINIKEYQVAKAEIKPMMYLVMNPMGEEIDLPGEPTIEPTFGLKAMWITDDLRLKAEQKGYTVVDSATVMITHLTEVLKDNIQELLTFADVQNLLDELPEAYKKLLNDIVPSQMTVSNIHRILQSLLAERVSIRDLTTILEGIAEACAQSRNLTIITEHVRLRLTRQITFANLNDEGYLPVVTLSPDWESEFMQSLVGDGEIKQFAMSPSRTQEFIQKFNRVFDQLLLNGENPVFITSGTIRPYIRSILERIRPSIPLMSQQEVHPKAKIKNLGQIQ